VHIENIHSYSIVLSYLCIDCFRSGFGLPRAGFHIFSKLYKRNVDCRAQCSKTDYKNIHHRRNQKCSKAVAHQIASEGQIERQLQLCRNKVQRCQIQLYIG
jgi:hypothetical protein